MAPVSRGSVYAPSRELTSAFLESALPPRCLYVVSTSSCSISARKASSDVQILVDEHLASDQLSLVEPSLYISEPRSESAASVRDS